jgi:UPF0176 protein
MWSKLEVVGRTYVAHEGINAQIAVPTEKLSQFREELHGIDFLSRAILICIFFKLSYI